MTTTRLSQELTKKEVINIIDHALYEERITLEKYDQLMRFAYNLAEDRVVKYEAVLND